MADGGGWAAGLARTDWRNEFEQTLPDLCEEDIAGSGFAVTGYTVPPGLGGDQGWRACASASETRSAKPARFCSQPHGLDHPWVEEHPEYYVAGTEADLARAPQNYTRLKRTKGDLIVAHGRDPYFAGWPDTLQLDYSNPVTQEAMIGELKKIAAAL